MNILCRQIINNLKPKKLRPKFLKLGTFATLGGTGGFLYSLSSVEEINDQSVPYIGGGVRFLRSMKIALEISLDYSFSSIGLNESSPNYSKMMSRIHQRAADKILEGCLANGGTYIKLGQGLVSMNHILPQEYIETLKGLQDKCLLRKPEEVQKLFMEDFGKTPEEMYKSFDNNAIAAASLAQVFKAKTNDGKEVAVKVQYIDLQSRFKSDIATIDFLLNIIGKVHKDFNFAWVINELKKSLIQELDFLNEAKNAEKCAKDLKHLKFVHVPKVHWDLCSRRVLVTEFINGYKISETNELINNGFSLADIDTKLFQMFGEQIFQTGFVHADPHPGNIFIRRHKGATQLVLLDHGLYEQISEKDRISLSHMWKAIVFNDHYKMEKYAKQLGVDDYVMFAEILTQVPLQRQDFKLGTALTEEDIVFMVQFARTRFDKVMSVLKSMPSTLILILRNLNTIRSIAQDHGNPVDRYEVLARSATRTAFEHSKHTVIQKIFYLPNKLYFELKILSNKLNMWLQRSFLKLLRLLGKLKAADAEILLEHLG